ncbi:MAG: hypothetical protein IPN90_02510 [Elusimicrobia bacterium]|nr:hypothetical protein [Elusimicrobiota bacterium]
MKKSYCIILLASFFNFSVNTPEVLGGDFQQPGMEQEGNSPSVKTDADDLRAKEELRWRKQWSAAKVQERGLFIAGLGGAVAGAAVVVAGVAEVNSADNTPGCSRDGNEILCDSAASQSEAQDKLDGGRSKAAIGLVVLGIGAGLGVWGVVRGNEADRLKGVGKKKLRWMTTQGRDGMAVMLSRSF